ncbi:C-type mannose receptor 2-like isoform X1 [Syngnathus scovelli]|nr:C-type mannose receptor 2-like isoform X2 [Syngnathus scovelli]
METPNGWLGAHHDCLWEGGDLVSITSSYEENFVKAQMGNKPFWIGLSNLFFEARKNMLTWSNTGVTPTYTNWDTHHNGSSNVESCAYINQGVHHLSQPGKWRHGSCGSSLAYMCQRSPDDCPDGWPCSYKDLGYSYNRVETSYCNSGEFLYNNSCYFFEGTFKTWQAAEDFCKTKQGHLTSVHFYFERLFLAAHRRAGDGWYSWVGLRKINGNFEWCDGSSTADVPWYYPKASGDCTKLHSNGQVTIGGCTDLRPFICKRGNVRDSLPLLPPSKSASGWSAKCGWWQENPSNNFCYLINLKPTKTWKEARDNCVSLRGNLLGITDSHEHTFIHGLLPNGHSLWLDTIVEDGSKQSEESSLSSVHLGASNPPGGHCNSLLSGKVGWEVVDCEKKSGYVSKRRVVQTCERTEGWHRFGSNCYKKMEATNGWLGARHNCLWQGGDLVSITSSYEENFVKAQMGDKPFWIGLSNLKCQKGWCQFFEAGEKRLNWSDTGVTPTYANWDSRQDESTNVESCAYINQGVHHFSQPGKWRHGSCGSSLAYMCERSPDDCPEGRLCSYKDYGFGYNRVESSYCNTGDFLYRDSCYHFDGTMRTWMEAEKFCGEWKGHLASVLSRDEGKFLTAHTPYAAERLQTWVGLKKNKDNFEWSDATPTGNIEWVPNGPTGRGGCCALSPTGQLEDWPCSDSRPFICKKDKVQGFLLPPPGGWSAKCGWWVELNNLCYLIQRRPTKTWEKARDDCLHRGGDLLSITDLHEQNIVKSLYTFLPSAPSLWLGVNNNITKDGSEWTDGSPFSYVLMNNADDPSDISGASCLSILTSNGRWKFDDCRKKRGYICKKKVNTPKPPQPHDGFKEIVVCNNRSAKLICEGQKQSRISIQSAFYGRRSDNICPVDSSPDDDYCAVEGILPLYRKMCNSHQKCQIELLEDESCPDVSKYLEMVYSCEQKVCLDSLGIANGTIADSLFKASSSMKDATPEKARLNGKSCWKPSKNPVGSWIQVNLGYARKVTGIVTQGCSNTHSWDIQLEMKLSVDTRKWTKHPDGKFIGGGTHLLGTPAFAKYIRILPLEKRPKFGLRLDILGCAHNNAIMTCARKFNSLHLTHWMTFYCPPGCAKSENLIRGTMVYSADSNICAAAIHAGIIHNDIGGDCVVMRAPKQQVYTGSTKNGITSRQSDDPMALSYTFADEEPRCLTPDWEEFAGFCYKYFEDERNWADAQQLCRHFGAELVSIRTEMEQARVKSASEFETNDLWTGLNDLALPGTFVWSDQRKVTFTHWAAGEPNQLGLGNNCVALLWQTGRWKLMSCTQVKTFMCKMPTAYFPISSKPQVEQ